MASGERMAQNVALRWAPRAAIICIGALALVFVLHARQTALAPGPPSAAPRSQPEKPSEASERAGPYAVALRLVDLLDEAVYYAPDAARAERALKSHWRRFLAPFAGPGGARGRIVQDVAVQRGAAHKQQAVAVGNGKSWTPDERIWNMTEGSFEQRECIFAPAPSSLRYRFVVPARAIFEAAPLVVASSAKVTFDVAITPESGKREALATCSIDAHEAHWRDLRVDLGRFAGRRVELELSTHGATAGVPAFWGTPVVLAPGVSELPFNVVFIVVDAMRGDAVARGHDDAIDAKIGAAPSAPLEAWLPKMPGLTPSLDALATGGAVFSQARSAATWTRPGTIAMLTGALSGSLGLNTTDILPNGAEVRRFYASHPPLLPLVLRPYGVITRAFVNNFYMFGYVGAGIDMGFEGLVDHRHATLDTERITSDAIAWLRDNRDRRFAVFVNYNSPHWPYAPPSSDLAVVAKSGSAPKDPTVKRYLGEIHKDDAAIGKLLDALDELGLADDTLVVTTADHGEPLSSDHDGVPVDLWRGVPPLGRFHHMLTAWDETTRVPLIFRYPKKIPKGVVSQAPASTIDILPTLLELAGLGAGPRIQGQSLVKAMNGTIAPRPLVTEARGARAIVDDHYRLIARDHEARRVRTPNGTRSIGYELYDLEADPGERADIAAKHPEVVARLTHELDTLTKNPPAAMAVSAAVPSTHPVIHLRFASAGAPHRITGHLGVDASTPSTRLVVSTVQLAKGAARGAAKSWDVEFTTSPASVVGFDVDVDPPTARVAWHFSIDDKPWPRARIYAGSFGLRAVALESGIDDETARLLVAAEVPPFIDARADFGLFVTRDAASHELDLDSTAAAEETLNLMQAWGYANQHPDADKTRK
jgi:arylsulfatase A-like enzyme